MGKLASNTTRNRAILDAFEAGATVSDLGKLYNLGEKTVRAVMADERNRRLSSPEPYYKQLRERLLTSG